MAPEPGTKRLRWAEIVLLITAAAAVWWALECSERRADWLRVEGPRRAVAGQRLPLRVHLASLSEPTRVCVDLHWGSTRDQSSGYLTGGGSKAAGREGGTFDFEVRVPPVQGLRFVTGIIYLSRTGGWADHTLVAVTEVIPVNSEQGGPAGARLEPLGLRPPGDVLSSHRRPAAFPRWLTALLFLAAAAKVWGQGRAAQDSAVTMGGWWRRVLPAVLALAFLCEALGIESWLGTQGRALARAWDLYYPRAALQKAVISGTLACGAALLISLQRVRPSGRLLLGALLAYVVVSLVNLVSLHTIDRVADLAWHGLSVMQALKLLCAALTLAGARRPLRVLPPIG